MVLHVTDRDEKRTVVTVTSIGSDSIVEHEVS
jgi:hypothetical protein